MFFNLVLVGGEGIVEIWEGRENLYRHKEEEYELSSNVILITSRVCPTVENHQVTICLFDSYHNTLQDFWIVTQIRIKQIKNKPNKVSFVAVDLVNIDHLYR